MHEEKRYTATQMLKPHPGNTEFLDDVTGETWKGFLESVTTTQAEEGYDDDADDALMRFHEHLCDIFFSRELDEDDWILLELLAYIACSFCHGNSIIDEFYEEYIKYQRKNGIEVDSFERIMQKCIKELHNAKKVRASE